jgi:hypothetical protein
LSAREEELRGGEEERHPQQGRKEREKRWMKEEEGKRVCCGAVADAFFGAFFCAFFSAFFGAFFGAFCGNHLLNAVLDGRIFFLLYGYCTGSNGWTALAKWIRQWYPTLDIPKNPDRWAIFALFQQSLEKAELDAPKGNPGNWTYKQVGLWWVCMKVRHLAGCA